MGRATQFWGGRRKINACPIIDAHPSAACVSAQRRPKKADTVTSGKSAQCYQRVDTLIVKPKRCALLGAQPNGHQGPMGNQGGGCACFWRGSDLRQPMRKSPEVAALSGRLYTPHLSTKVHLNRAVWRREACEEKRHTHTLQAQQQQHLILAQRGSSFVILELCWKGFGDVQRSVIEQRAGEVGGQEDLPSPQTHKRLPQPLWTGGSWGTEPGDESQAAGDFRAGPAEMEL